MLQYWQSILFFPTIIEESFHQHGFDSGTGLFYRFTDCFFALISYQGRHEVLACADRLGQAVKLRAISNKIRTHGQHDVDFALAAPACLHQQLDELNRLLAPTCVRHIAATRAAVAKHFLKLVDEDEE